MTTRIKLRKDTASNWMSADPILSLGEPGLETDTGKMKYGDGVTKWSLLNTRTDVSRNKFGWINLLGDMPNNNNDFWYETVIADANGNSYYCGGNYTDRRPVVVKIDATGAIVWQEFIQVQAWDGTASGDAISLALDPNDSARLHVVSQVYGDFNDVLFYCQVSTDTGAMVPDSVTVVKDWDQNSSSVQPSDMVVNAMGHPIIVGRKYGDDVTHPVTPLTGSGFGLVIINASDITDGDRPQLYNGWYIVDTANGNQQYDVEAINTYSNVPTTNLVASGSNFQPQIRYDSTTGVYYNAGISNQGGGYSQDDTVTVLGTDVGGTSPANDVVLTLINVVDGMVYDYSCEQVTARGNTSILRLMFNNNFDASQGSWGVLEYKNSQAFIWSPALTAQSLGGSGNDQFDAVTQDSMGNIFAVGQTYDTVSGNYRGFVSKFNVGGVLQWSAYILENSRTSSSDVTGIVVDASDNIVVAQSGNNYALTVTKLNNAGETLWQRGFSGMFDTWNPCVDVDADGNYIIAMESGSVISQNDDFIILSISPTGDRLWTRNFGSDSNDGSNWNNSYQLLSVAGNKFYMNGSTYAYNGNGNANAFALSLPVDGSGTNEIFGGHWRYIDSLGAYGESWNILNTADTAVMFALPAAETALTYDNPSNVPTTSTSYTETKVSVLSGSGGTVTGVKSITFEDGTELSSATASYITRSNWSQGDDSYWIQKSDAGKTLYYFGEYGNSWIYVPPSYQEKFEIGTVITIAMDYFDGNRIYLNNDGNGSVTILAAGQNTNQSSWYYLGGSGNAGVYTLMLVHDDDNGNTRWILSGPEITWAD
jgi:hypothetical protein